MPAVGCQLRNLAESAWSTSYVLGKSMALPSMPFDCKGMDRMQWVTVGGLLSSNAGLQESTVPSRMHHGRETAASTLLLLQLTGCLCYAHR